MSSPSSTSVTQGSQWYVHAAHWPARAHHLGTHGDPSTSNRWSAFGRVALACTAQSHLFQQTPYPRLRRSARSGWSLARLSLLAYVTGGARSSWPMSASTLPRRRLAPRTKSVTSPQGSVLAQHICVTCVRSFTKPSMVYSARTAAGMPVVIPAHQSAGTRPGKSVKSPAPVPVTPHCEPVDAGA